LALQVKTIIELFFESSFSASSTPSTGSS
jgi:hypothetical protein